LIYATGGGGRIVGFDVKSGEIKKDWNTVPGDRENLKIIRRRLNESIYNLNVSPDGRFVAVIARKDGHVMVFNSETGEKLLEAATCAEKITPSPDTTGIPIRCLAFSPDSKYLAVPEPNKPAVKFIPMPKE
jgi:WD40 repeat protein